MDQSIDLCVLRDACHKLFCVFKDFYASGTQDAEVAKTLLHEKNSLKSKKHKAKVFNTSVPW